MDFTERTDVDVMIGRLNRMQIGYSFIIEYALEENINEDEILEDDERMVEKCFDVEDVKQTSRLVLNRIKEKNNY